MGIFGMSEEGSLFNDVIKYIFTTNDCATALLALYYSQTSILAVGTRNKLSAKLLDGNVKRFHRKLVNIEKR